MMTMEVIHSEFDQGRRRRRTRKAAATQHTRKETKATMSADLSSSKAKAMELFTANQQRLKELFEKLAPVFSTVSHVADVLAPYAVSAWATGQRTWTALQPYHPEELFEAVFGIVLCFFGGRYVLTLAAIEAYKMCGW
jgi:hypothetical protein